MTEVVTVDPSRIEVRREGIGGLVVINAVLDRLCFDGLIDDHLPPVSARVALAPARAIGVLVRNLAIGRMPLYGLSHWASRYRAELLGLRPGQAGLLSDDRVGRALDVLFDADRATMMTQLSRRAIEAFGICVDELHNDTTSLTLYGAYHNATGTPRAGKAPPVPAFGHSKDRRGDLKQLVENLTVSGDGAVPMVHQLADGNTEDSTTHIDTWGTCRVIVGRAEFLYVADSKLATRPNMGHIAAEGGRFLCILPRTRTEEADGRAWLASGPIPFVEIARRPGLRRDDPPEVFSAVEAPWPSVEGYRIVWFHSSVKTVQDGASRYERIAKATAGLSALSASLGSPRSRLKSAQAIEEAARAVVAGAHASSWMRYQVSSQVVSTYRQAKAGRPGPDTAYRRVDRTTFGLSYWVDAARVATDAASDGCFPMITNDRAMSQAELLRAQKAQPHLERRHATFKGVLEATPVELKSDYRIDALAFCLYVALLVHALIERELRRAMADAGIAQLPLYYEDRPCTYPSAARVLEVLDPLSRTIVLHDGQQLAVQQPSPDQLQTQILNLLGCALPHFSASTTVQ